MPLDTEKLVARLYRETDAPKGWRVRLTSGVRTWYRRRAARRALRRGNRRPIGPRLRAWARRHARALTVTGLLTVAWLAFHVYWFNRLTHLKYNVDAVWSQVEAEQERRFHIQQSVTRLIIAYAQQERNLMLDLTELRAGARDGRAPTAPPASAMPVDDLADLGPAELDRVFPNIMMMAEQYPQLRSTENFQQFSQAIIDTETRVTERIHTYNDHINAYTTVLQQFPGNVFGAIWGFDIIPFYTPEREATRYHVVQYDAAGQTTGPIAR